MKTRCYLALLLLGCYGMSISAATRTLALQERLKDATRLQVTENYSGLVTPIPEKVLIEVTDPREVRELISHLKFDEKAPCYDSASFGEERLVFYSSTTQTANLKIINGYMLTNDGDLGGSDGDIWDCDVLMLSDSAEFLANWLEKRGVNGPKESLGFWNKSAAEMTPEKKEWLKVTPSSLRPFWPKMAGPFGESMTDELHQALRKQYPDKKKRILVLFEWYGSGTSHMGRNADYENRAEQLLLNFKTSELVEALISVELNSRQLEGALQLFCGHHYTYGRKDDTKLLPSKLKKQLIGYAHQSKYEHIRDRAKDILTPPQAD